jgi:hypothetical protein
MSPCLQRPRKRGSAQTVAALGKQEIGSAKLTDLLITDLLITFECLDPSGFGLDRPWLSGVSSVSLRV